MTTLQIAFLAMIQGIAELLPISSSAHVIMAEKWMGIDPSTPEMTFLLVMLHTGTMFTVLFYFWPRWRKLDREFWKKIILATAATGVIGLGLKTFIEKVILAKLLGESNAEIEHLFKSTKLISFSLFSVGLLIFYTGSRDEKLGEASEAQNLSSKTSIWVGLIQGLCLPFRGFSRSGATISTALLRRVPRALAEDFSFALALVLTPPVIIREGYRLVKSVRAQTGSTASVTEIIFSSFAPGMIGMVFSAMAGLMALKWLSAWLEHGKWKYFGIYCMISATLIFIVNP